ncbi:VanZ like family protein [Mycobacteroides franklinii]|uniref:VanZ like family protein n=3 Tax=Mycobacteriaceae TaxID=1762 RepID=A0A4R8R7F8_9MYCO|nr:VanZ like family protein [Mycobacteroides franklinii]TDZ52206.1 VanZ like family protein [Mycobacteroides franklinii]TDZ55613.1 VanZ like family protein [Mycobacteroides franklinii]TDZ62554.1 VanZ like family protein [Mycobacteroides franklinii]TDZ68951.1 VanZ like family protein [Mycobacteroides franklinii]
MIRMVRSWSLYLRRLTLLGAFAVACLLLFTPGGTVPSGPPGADKVAHVLIFAMLAACSRFAKIDEKRTLTWVLVFAASSEVIQALWIPRRDGSLLDLLADAIGLLTGLLLWRKIRRGPRRAPQ